MLRIRHLLISINTDKGQFGVRRDFADGVNIVRAENWAGKSTLFNRLFMHWGWRECSAHPTTFPFHTRYGLSGIYGWTGEGS